MRDSVKGYQQAVLLSGATLPARLFLAHLMHLVQVKVRVNKEASVKELIQAAADEVGEGHLLQHAQCI